MYLEQFSGGIAVSQTAWQIQSGAIAGEVADADGCTDWLLTPFWGHPVQPGHVPRVTAAFLMTLTMSVFRSTRPR